MRKELLFTVFVSVAFIFLQAFWIVRMYQRYEEQYTEQVNKAFLDAIGKEVELRIRYVEEFKTPILIKPTGCVSEKERTGYKGDTIDLVLLKQNDIVRNVSEFLAQLEQDELLSNRMFPVLPVIDSLLREELSGLKIDHYLSLYDKEGTLLCGGSVGLSKYGKLSGRRGYFLCK